jgi:prevent-host-death family protein
MTTVSVHEAKTHLSRLINRVLAGEEITVSRGKEEVIKLVPAHPVKKKDRQLGWLAHTLPAGKDPLEDGFWDPLPDDELGLWNGESQPHDPAQ